MFLQYISLHLSVVGVGKSDIGLDYLSTPRYDVNIFIKEN